MRKFLKIVVIVILCYNTATAESELPPCQGEDHMQWTNCFGSYTNRDVTDYILKNFTRMNELYPNSSYKENYEGEFGSIPGLKNGYGKKILYLNNEIYSTYEGQYLNNQRNGYGEYTNLKKNGMYKGNFKNNLKHGQGTQTWSNGKKYVGEWKRGAANGEGTITLPNGNNYVGEWKDGLKNGQGTETLPDGDKYVGEYKRGAANGQGTYTWSNGDKYVGEYKRGAANGQGTYTWSNGKKYVGEWKDGQQNGQGTYTWPNGNKEVAIYKDGEVVKIISSTKKKVNFGAQKTLTGFTYITMMDKGIADNGIWGTRCNYSDGSYREIKSSDPGGPPPRC